MTQANANTGYLCPLIFENHRTVTAQQYIDQSPEAQEALRMLQLVSAKSLYLIGSELLESLVSFSLEDDRLFANAVVHEMTKTYRSVFDGSVKKAGALAREIVALMPDRLRKDGKIGLLWWDVVFRAISTFIQEGSSEATGFHVEPDEYPDQERLDCP